MKRKAVAAVLTAVMVASMFTGCGSDNGSSSAKSASAASAANDTVDEDGKVNGIMYQEGLPLVDEGEMRIGYITHRKGRRSQLGDSYLEALKKYLE